MEYRNLGRTGVKVSPLCLGCMTFGRELDQDGAFAIMDQAFDAGINFFDTANVYNQGRSEEIVGAWLSHHNRRHDVVLATKVFGRMGERPNQSGLSRRHIMEQADASLQRLGTDHIDLYQIHRWDPETPIEETLRALDDLVHAGKVRYLGCSNVAGWQLMKALWTSDRYGLNRFVSIQPPYSMIRRGSEDDVLPACQDQGLGVIPYSPLAGGFLSGKYRREDGPPQDTRLDRTPMYRDLYWSDKSFRIVDMLRGEAEQRGLPMADLALAWVASHPAVTAPIIGVRRAEHIEQGLRALQIKLAPDERAALSRKATEAERGEG